MLKKKYLIFLVLTFLAFSIPLISQTNGKKVEVLYFKANLACCKARACNALQSDVESVLKTHFSGNNIEFKVIKLSDESNKDIVDKFNAKSQTVIILTKTGNKESFIDVSDIVKEYSRRNEKEKFIEDMKNKIQEAIK